MKIAVIALGCPKNLVDTEIMLGLLDEAGHSVVGDAAGADVVILTTCSFISPAVHESLRVAAECLALKREGKVGRVIVAGCLPQRFGSETFDMLPGVDAVVGADAFGAIADVVDEVAAGDTVFAVDEPTALYDDTFPRIIATPAHLAYVKIADGCDNRCAYCTIPSIRGRLRSRTSESVAREVGSLVQMGAREINLIAQDTTAYGTDIALSSGLVDLLATLSRSGARWIRLLYTHPAHVTKDLLSAIAETEHVVPYLDMPIQHISERVLSSMNRHVSGQKIRELVTLAREIIPGVSIRSSVMVGYPGETREDYDELLAFVEAGNIDHLGVFEYSPESGTPAAELKGRVPDGVTSERARRLVATMEALTEKRGRALVGRQAIAIVDEVRARPEGVAVVGRTEGQAWEMDGSVLIECEGRVPDPGDIVRFIITGADGFDLRGVTGGRPPDASESA